MESTSHYLPLHIRAYILALKEDGEKYDIIVEKVLKNYGRHISYGTITKIGDKFEAINSVNDLPKSGRPRIFTQEEEHNIIEAVLKERKTTAMDIWGDPYLNKAGACVRTIQNLLAEEGLQASSRLPEYIPPHAFEKRLLFATQFVESPGIWAKVVFSDEADIFPYKSGKLYVRCYRGEIDVERYNMRTRRDPRTIKIWGCVSRFGVGPLIRYDGTVNATNYLELLQQTLLRSYPGLKGTRTRPGPLLFQQDGAKPHTAKIVKSWLQEQHIHFLDWPPYSPDISLIENLWAILEDELYKKNDVLENAEEVWQETQKIWYKKLNVYVENLYKSMPNRIKEVIKNEGRRIDY